MALLLWQSLPAARAEQAVVRDQLYVPKGDVNQKLDLFVPPNIVSPPLCVFIHGGGWLTGDKNMVPTFLMNTGYAVASINMRPSSTAKYPAQYDDCISAIGWLRANAPKYGYDPDTLILVGASSGAHLACLLASREWPGRESLKCVVDVSGPTNLYSILAHVKKGQLGQESFITPRGQLAQFIGGDPRTHSAAALAASPVTYVNAKTAPILIVHGGMDEIIPYDQATELHRRLDVFGVKNDLVLLPTAPHNIAATDWERVFHLFVDRYVPKPKSTVVQRPAPPPKPMAPPTPPMSPWLPESLLPPQRPDFAMPAVPTSQAALVEAQEQAKAQAKNATQSQGKSTAQSKAQAKGDKHSAPHAMAHDGASAPVGFHARHEAAAAAQAAQASQSVQR